MPDSHRDSPVAAFIPASPAASRGTSRAWAVQKGA